MNKFIICILVAFQSSCTVNNLVPSDDVVTTSYSVSKYSQPYWSNHFFDTGYGFHNMGYWGVGSWDIGSFDKKRYF